MDGPLLLTRVVRKAMVSFEAINAQGDASTVQVDCLAPELTPRPLVGILCNDLLVLCRDPSEGQDVASSVDLWAVLRMQTLPQPASIVHGNCTCSMLGALQQSHYNLVAALRLVDNKAILYFDAPSPSDALNWYRGGSSSLTVISMTDHGLQLSTYTFRLQKRRSDRSHIHSLICLLSSHKLYSFIAPSLSHIHCSSFFTFLLIFSD